MTEKITIVWKEEKISKIEFTKEFIESIIGKPITLNFNTNKPIGKILSAKLVDNKMEFVGEINNEFYINQIKDGVIKHVSPQCYTLKAEEHIHE